MQSARDLSAQAGRFVLQAVRWAGALYFLGVPGLLLVKSCWAILAAPGQADIRISNGELVINTAAREDTMHILTFILTGAFGLGLVALLTWLLRRVSRREFCVHNAVILGMLVLGVGVEQGLRPEPARQMGKPMPALEVDYLTPRPELSGRVVLVEFWATWCGPCIANIPHLNELQAKFRDRGLVVVGISSEADRDGVEKFWQNGTMHYAVAIQSSGDLQNQLGVRGIPHSFLVSRTGQIIWEGHPASLTTPQIEAALR
jgi:thiol-disulfide isomerase/thioredoxin